MSDPSPYAVLKLADFRLLLIGRLLGTVAVQIQAIAVGWQIYSITKNPLALGFIGLAEALPAIGVALYAGHVADVVDRRRIAISCLVALCMSMLLLSLSSHYVADQNQLVMLIFTVVALSGFARGFYGPAVFGMVSDIVPRELLGNASAWNSTTWQASAMAGPMLGGWIYVWLAAPATYLFSFALLLGSVLCFALIKARTVLSSKKVVSIVANIKEGLSFVFSNQIILGAMALDLFAVLFGGAVALLPVFTDKIFHTGPEALGMLRAAPSLGAVLTAAILTHRPIARHSGVVLMLAVAGFGLCMIAFGLSTNFYLSLGLLALSGALDGVSIWVRSTIFQLVTPNEMKGRVSAVNNIFIGSSNEIGEFESGVTAKLMGLVPSVVFGGCMTLLVVLFTAFRAPELRRLHVQSLYTQPLEANKEE
ncbi:MAG: MFS transporter [Cyanobacteria bacterium SZAS LIN-2]|nr:MFS transporter [Cyanobacteria bacterium SZAS LIN-2]